MIIVIKMNSEETEASKDIGEHIIYRPHSESLGHIQEGDTIILMPDTWDHGCDESLLQAREVSMTVTAGSFTGLRSYLHQHGFIPFSAMDPAALNLRFGTSYQEAIAIQYITPDPDAEEKKSYYEKRFGEKTRETIARYIAERIRETMPDGNRAVAFMPEADRRRIMRNVGLLCTDAVIDNLALYIKEHYSGENTDDFHHEPLTDGHSLFWRLPDDILRQYLDMLTDYSIHEIRSHNSDHVRDWFNAYMAADRKKNDNDQEE